MHPVVAVGGVVITSPRPDRPRVLLVRRRNPPMVGSWTFPGGRLAGGESIARGIEREVMEETSVRVTCGALIEVVEIITEGYHYVIHDHLCALLDGDANAANAVVAGDDAAEARHVEIAELSAFGVTEATRRVVMRGLAMFRAGSDGA